MSEKQYEVIVTPFAESSLQDYADSIRYDLLDDETADLFLDRMEQAIRELGYLPYRYTLVTKEPWHSNGIRFFPHIGYNIYYWINEARMRVYVTDVINQKMDQDKRLLKAMIANDKVKREDN
jgi:toxin ParE1/3/4